MSAPIKRADKLAEWAIQATGYIPKIAYDPDSELSGEAACTICKWTFYNSEKPHQLSCERKAKDADLILIVGPNEKDIPGKIVALAKARFDLLNQKK